MSEYIFGKQAEDQEIRRLRMIEAAFDPSTIEGLQKTGIKTGWRCLEIGAGAGSIAKWMSEQVGKAGSVVVIDKDTKHLQALHGTDCEIIQGDFSEIDLAGQFDLIHCRYVLIHNKNDVALLEKIRRHLKPEGRVLLEEPDFGSALMLNPASDLPAKKVNQAICALYRTMDLDPIYGIHLPDQLMRSGYKILHLDAPLHFCSGNSPVAKIMGASVDALREKYIDTGEADEADEAAVAAYIKNAGNDDYWSVYYATVSIIAKSASV